MGALLSLPQIVLGTTGQHFHLEVQIFIQNLTQGQNTRLLLVIHQRQQNNTKGTLQRSLLKEIIQHHLGICILLQFDNDTHTVTIGFVTQVRNTLQTLCAYLLRDVLDQLALIDLIRQLANDDAHTILTEFFEFGLCSDHNTATASSISCADTAATHNNAAGGEIGTGHMLHQIRQRCFRIIQHADTRIDHFRQVVRGNIGGHTDRDTGRTIDQQVRKTAGQNPRFFFGFIEVGIPVDGFLIDVPKHFVGKLGKSCLSVTVSSSGVAVYATEVTVAIDQHITHREILRKTNHGIVYGCVAMGMVLTQNITDTGSGLLKRLIRSQTALIHGVEDSAVYGLQAISHIRQSAANDDAHGVFNIGFFHFIDQITLNDGLIREHNVLGLVITIMVCQTASPP